jgi:hypothetical protein
MTRGDQAVEKGSEKLRDLSEKAAERGGVAEKLAEPLADDAAFLRKLKPSLIIARARGQAPTDGTPGQPAAAPPGTQMTRAREKKKKKSGGPNPLAVVAGTFGLGYLLAKVIDWRGHAHPND